jgi:hypothetical protein
MFKEVADQGEETFAPVLARWGCTRTRRTVRKDGFVLWYANQHVRVRIEYFIRGGLYVGICPLGGDRDEPPCYDLFDVEAVATSTEPQPNLSELYAIPTAEVLAATAKRVAAVCGPLLDGDFAQVPQLEQRVENRRA